MTIPKLRIIRAAQGLLARGPTSALQHVGLFADMDRRQAQQIGRRLKESRFAKGEAMIREGCAGTALYLIMPGQAGMSHDGTTITTSGPGDHFGAIALIDGGPRSATVKAATDLVCCGLTFWEFRPLVERNATIA